jgi:glycosyltransferase involved in cell wall biosynthesis
MATFNGERFIVQQLHTILSQLAPNDEVVISDDSSVDGTVRLIQGFRDDRIRLFRNDRNRSVVGNFENALTHARGDFIFLSDQDDEWVDGWVEAALIELGETCLIVCDVEIIDEVGLVKAPNPGTQNLGARRTGLVRNLWKNGYIGCCCAFRRQVLEAALPFPDEIAWHDWWLGLVAEALFSSRFIEGKWIRYRRHGNNVSSTSGPSNSSLKRKIRMRWRLASALFTRFLDIKFRH